jgi:glycosyltransferase involved in cell wall biosynthesis
MAKASLSVVMPNYNHGRHISRAIEAVVSQSRKPDEFLILDDGSTDQSIEIIEGYAKRCGFITLIRNERNQGVEAAVQRLLETATGDYFFSVAADDFILPGYLEKALALLERFPHAGFCSALSLVVDKNGHDRGIFPSPIVSGTSLYLNPQRVRKTLLKHGAWFMGNTAIYRRDKLIESGGFRPELQSFTDGFIQHVLALKHGACFIPEPFAAWRKMETGVAMSTNMNIKQIRKVHRYAIELMESSSEYGTLFPPKYIRQWRKRQNYWVGEALQKTIQKDQKGYLEGMKVLLQDPGFLNRLFILFLRVFFFFQSWLMTFHLLIISFTWPATPLMLRWIARNALYRIRNGPLHHGR